MVRSEPAAWAALRLALLVLVLSCPALSRAQDAPKSAAQQFWEQRFLTGDWGGARSWLLKRGVGIGGRYTAGVWSNVHGGLDSGSRYEGFLEWWLELEFEPLLGWKGGGFTFSGYDYHGGLPTDELVGGIGTQAVSGNETANSFRFFEIFFRQSWSGPRGHALFKIGQLAGDTDFFFSPHTDVFLNGAFGFLGLGRERELIPIFPLAAPGVFARVSTFDLRWEGSLGVYLADAGEDVPDNIGFGYESDEGVSILAKLRHRRRLFDRSLDLVFGGFFTTREIANFETLRPESGTYGIYALLDYQLVEVASDHPGLGVFLRGYGSPEQDRNLLYWYFDVGLHVRRPLPSRSRDVVGLGFAFLRFADPYVDAQRARGENVSRQQSVLEATYRFQANAWLSLHLDFQYFFEPHFSRRNATLIGFRAEVEL